MKIHEFFKHRGSKDSHEPIQAWALQTWGCASKPSRGALIRLEVKSCKVAGDGARIFESFVILNRVFFFDSFLMFLFWHGF